MNDLLFYLTILALLYYFFYYLPSQKKLNANLPLQQHQELEELKANLKEAIVEWEKQEKAVENLGQLKNGFERNVFDFLDIYETEWLEFLKKKGWDPLIFFADASSSDCASGVWVDTMTENMKEFFQAFSDFVQEINQQNQATQTKNKDYQVQITKLQTEIRELVKRPVQPTNSKGTQTDDKDLENTLDTLIKGIQKLNNSLN